MADQGDTNDTDATTTEAPPATETAAVETTEATVEDTATILESGGADTKAEGSDAEGQTDGDAKEGDADQDEDGKQDEGAPDTYSFVAPEGMEIDESLVERFSPAFKELNLSNEQAQGLADLFGEHLQQQQAKQDADHAEQRKAWKTEFAKTPDSPKLAAQAKRAIDKFVKEQDPDTYDLLTQTWLGDHPGIVNAFARIGAVIAEDTFAGSSAGGGKIKDARAIYPSMQNP